MQHSEHIQLIEHILAVDANNPTWAGHPGWPEIVGLARAARDTDTDTTLEEDEHIPVLDAVDRQLLKKPVKRYVGVGVFEWEKGQRAMDVVFVSSVEVDLEGRYHTYRGHQVTSCWITSDMKSVDLAIDFAEKTMGSLPLDSLCNILEIDTDGWGLFQYMAESEGPGRWDLVESYDAIQQQEIDMADQAHINDLRFGADSDYCPGDELHDPFGDMR